MVRSDKSRSCVDFAEIVSRFHLERSSRDRVSILPRSCVDFARCSLEFGSDLKIFTDVENCREIGDKSLMEEFFNSLEEIIQRLESRRSENVVHMQSEQKAGRPLGRPACTTWCTTTVRSAERSTDCTTKFLLRVDRLAQPRLLLGSIDRPSVRRNGRSTRAVDRQSDLLIL